uniref:TRP_2 domain-containing protein n=1 Tax=Bursaphelenchus xylophilus TaxID=6326 RepID=A0A1I7RJA5_BURXY
MIGAGDAAARVLSGIRHICVKPEALLEVKAEGCEAIYQWHMSDEVVLAMRVFCNAVQERNVDKVQRFISGLMAAEEEDSKPQIMAEKLCTGEVEKFKEVLLIAILSGSRPLTEFVLQLFVNCPSAEHTGCINSTIFPPHLTPLMVACLSNNFALVECLLLRGHYVELPHRHDCACFECKHHNAAGRMDVKRLDLFRVVCSEAFLWLATDDPLLSAMHLIEDLRLSLGFNNEHKEVYAELLNRVNTYTVAISQHCWSFEEMEVILSQKRGSRAIYCDEHYPRALLAIEKQMKPENEEPEWKYTRSYIYSEYWHTHTTLPPPFNIIVLGIELCNYWAKMFRDQLDLEAEAEVEQQNNRAYQRLLVVIFRRYVASQRFHFINSSVMDKSPNIQMPANKINFLNHVLHNPKEAPSSHQGRPKEPRETTRTPGTPSEQPPQQQPAAGNTQQQPATGNPPQQQQPAANPPQQQPAAGNPPQQQPAASNPPQQRPVAANTPQQPTTRNPQQQSAANQPRKPAAGK